MADMSQIEILVSELERLFITLNESLRTGVAEDGLTEVKVAKALLADSAKVLRSFDGSVSKNLDEITSDIKSFIEAIEVDPASGKQHSKISAYLEGKYFNKLVDAAYAKAVGDASDTDTIINTFKELQEVIGAADKDGNTGLGSILNRIATLNGLITDLGNQVEYMQGQITSDVDGKISDLKTYVDSKDSALQVQIDEANADLVSLTNSTTSRFSLNEGLISGLRIDLDKEVNDRKAADAVIDAKVSSNYDEFKAYELMLGSSAKVIPAIGRLSNLKVSSLWKTTL